MLPDGVVGWGGEQEDAGCTSSLPGYDDLNWPGPGLGYLPFHKI